MAKEKILDNEEFKGKLTQTKDSEKAEQNAADSEVLEDVIIGRQEVHITGYGLVVFDFPTTGLALEGDTVIAKFRTRALRSGEYLTESQLKAIYGQPITVHQDGKDIVVGTAEWPEKYDIELEELPKKISDCQEMFNSYREDYQKYRDEAAPLKNSKKKTDLEEKRDYAEKEAAVQYSLILQLKSRQLELNSIRARLFADSLEEQAFFEKVKFFAPSCIKKYDGEEVVPLWKTEQEMLADGFNGTRVLTLFNLFMRGLDVSFFGDVPGGTISS